MNPPSADWIQHESDALRRLARGLVGCEAAAEDVVQQARLAVWQQGSRGGPGYLRGVVRHLARRFGRDQRRRRVHENANANANCPPALAVDEALARHEVAKAVANAVAELREPFRETVVLRFYEGLPPRAIARRLGIPVATVRSRVQRGLAALRAALDQQCGDRHHWRLGLAAAFGIPAAGSGAVPANVDGWVTTATSFAGSWIMPKVVLSVLLLVGLSTLFLLWNPSEPPGTANVSDGGAAGANGVAVEIATAAGGEDPSGATRRVAIEPEARRSWRIVVTDPEAVAVPGVAVFAGSGSNDLRLLGRTAAGGSLRLDVAAPDPVPRFVLAAGAGHGPSALHELNEPAGREIRLVVRPGPVGRIAGRIFDPAGLPLPGVAVYAGRNEPAAASQRARGITTRTPGLVAMTDDNGTFAIDGVLAGWFRFIAMHPDHAPLVVFQEVLAGAECRIEKRLRGGTVVTGRVLDEGSSPVAGATVGQGSLRGFDLRTVITAADGSYRTAPLNPGQKVALRDAAGRQRNTIRIPKAAGDVFVWDPILGAGEAKIRGRVISNERAVADLIVRVKRRGQPWRDSVVVRADAAFVLARPSGRVLRFGVFAGPDGLPLLLADVKVSDSAPVLLELPARQGIGRVVATRAVGDDSEWMLRCEVGEAPTQVGAALTDAATGACVWEGVPGGASYRVVVDLGSAGEYTLARLQMPLAGGELDLGELVSPELIPVRFELQRHPSAARSTIEYRLERIDDNPARLLDSVGSIPTGPHLLPPGRYMLEVELAPGVRRVTRFVVQPGASTTVPVRLDARADYGFSVRGLQPGERARLSLWRIDAAGRPGEPIELTVVADVTATEARAGALPLTGGRYRVEVLADGGGRAAHDLHVASSEFDQPPVAGALVADNELLFVLELR